MSKSPFRSLGTPLPIALVLAALFWIFDSGLDTLVFGERSFAGQLFVRDPHDLSSRLLVVGMIVAFGVYARSVHTRLRRRILAREHDLALEREKLAVTEERERLARELHDSVSQSLFSVTLMADAIPLVWKQDPAEGERQLGALRDVTRSALAEMRALLLELRPDSLAGADMHELLEHLADSVNGRTRMPVEVSVDGCCVLPTESRVALYRIAQQALGNVTKHARAGKASVSLRCGPERSELRIEDDGCGFDPAQVPAESMGLSIMRERAEKSGARLTIDSRPSAGTRILAIWDRGPSRPEVGAESTLPISSQ